MLIPFLPFLLLSLPSRVDLMERAEVRPQPSVAGSEGWPRGRWGHWESMETFHLLHVHTLLRYETLEIQPIYLETSCMLVILDTLPDEPKMLF